MASGEGRSGDIPVYYGSKNTNDELIKHQISGPGQALEPATPPRSYQPGMFSPGPSSERTPIESHPAYNDDIGRPIIGLRRRPSQTPQRRCSGGEYDYRIDSFSSERKPLRSRDENFYNEQPPAPRRDLDWQTSPHPDAYWGSRPPRTYRNIDRWERGPGKPSVEETKLGYDGRERDLERGECGIERKMSEESVDGYDYAAHAHKKFDINNLTPEKKAAVMRLPWTQWMNSNIKNHFVATLGEFVGTTMFLFFAFAGTQVANISSVSTSDTTTGGATGFNISVYLYIALIFGFSLMVNVWIFFRISGGLFNPAVTFGMVLAGALPITRAICLFFAQIAGGIAASAMTLGLFPTKFNVRTTLSDNTSLVRGVFIEAILTAELVFTIFMLAKEKHKATFIAPVGIGLALFIAEMVGVFYTGGSLNPARSFGLCVVTGTFDQDHWIYWAGPGIGALIAVFFYKFIKMLEYEVANPGQDGDSIHDLTQSEQKKSELLEARLKRTIKSHHWRTGSRGSGEKGANGRPESMRGSG